MTFTAGKSIAGRMLPGLTSTVVYQIIAAANAILLVPLFLKAWGAEGYGNWLSLTAAVSCISLLDFGGQNYIGNLLARDFAKGNENGFRKTFSEGISLFSLIAVGALCALLLILSVPFLRLPGHGILGMKERLILLLMGSSFVLSVPLGVFVTVFRSTGMYFGPTMLGNGIRALSLAGYAGILLAGLAPVAYAAGYLVSTIVLVSVVTWYGYRTIPLCRGIRPNVADAVAGRSYLGESLIFWLIAIGGAINLQGVVLVLGATVLPAAVALYVTHRTVSGLLGYVGNLFMSVLWPEISFLDASGELEKLRRFVLLGIRMVVFLSASGAVLLWVLLPDIYPLWTSRRLDLHPDLLGLFLLQGVLAAGWNTAGWVLLASNQHRRIAHWALANAVLTIFLAVLFAPRYGVMGVALATIVGDVVCGAAVYPRLAARQILLPARKMYSAILLPALAVLPAGVLMFLASRFVAGKGMRILAGGMISLVLVYPTVRLALGRTDLNWIMERLRHQLVGARV